MARTAPIPNIPAIPGMCPGIAVLGGGGGSGGSGGKGAGAGGGGVGAGGQAGAGNTDGDGRGSPDAGRFPGCGTASHPVDVATGRAFTHPITDMHLPGAMTLRFERCYSSTNAQRDCGLGYGWGHSFGWEVEVRRRGIRVWTEKGTAVDFPIIQPGSQCIGPWGWVLRREKWGFALDTDNGLWYLLSEASEDGKRFRLGAIDDRNGNRTSLEYQRGCLTRAIDAAGRVVDITSAPDGHILAISVTNPDNASESICFGRYEYDGAGNMIRATDADGYSCHYQYDDAHRLVVDRDRVGLIFQFVYDSAGRCIESWGHYGERADPSLVANLPTTLADGTTPAKGIHHCRFLFMEDGYSEVVDAVQVRRFFSNQHGLLDKRLDGSGVCTATYDERGRMLSTTNAVGATHHYRRDPRGRVLEHTDPYGHTTTFDLHASGLVERIVDALGGETIIDRDARGNVVRHVDASGGISAFAYNQQGQVVSSTDPLGGSQRMEYDRHGNIIAITHENGAVWRYRYDYFGRRVERTDPLGNTLRYEHSARGDLLAILDEASGDGYRYRYDGERHIIADQMPGGQKGMGYQWGGYHKLTARIQPDGRTTRLRYGRSGELLEVQNPAGQVHRFYRDINMRIAAEVTFDGREIRYQADEMGRVIRRTDEAGVSDYVYGLNNELLERTLNDDSSDTFEYDASGALVAAHSSDGVSFRIDYDRTSRRITETQLVDGVAQAVETQLDARGRIAHRSSTLGLDERVERDAVGARKRTVLRAADGATLTLTHQADALGREVSRQLPNGGRIDSRFDWAGRLLARRAYSPSAHIEVGPDEPAWVGEQAAGITVDKAYQYNGDGEIILATDAQRGNTSYRYDPARRLLEMVGEDARRFVFSYDEAGNRQGGAVVIGMDGPGAAAHYERGRTISDGNTSYRYDERGQLAEKRVKQADGNEAIWRYHFNGRGQLAKVETPQNRLVTFRYDAYSRRMQKKVTRRSPDGRAPQVESVTRFVWDDCVLVHEICQRADADGNPLVERRSYSFEDDSYEPLAQHSHITGGTDDEQTRQQPWLSFLNNAAGAPDRLIAPNGQVACEMVWGPWGEAEVRSEVGADTQLRLAGQYADEETGLYYNRYRYYDPALGRFISPDPIGLEGNFHPYLFAPNAIGWIDPEGLMRTARGAPTLLGRDMRGRVIPGSRNPTYVSGSGPSRFHWYDTNSRFTRSDPGAEMAWKKNQRRWIRDQIRSGRGIYDIGTPSSYTPSTYCDIERRELEAAGFTQVCTGATMAITRPDGSTEHVDLKRWEPPAGFDPDNYHPRTAAECRGGTP